MAPDTLQDMIPIGGDDGEGYGTAVLVVDVAEAFSGRCCIEWGAIPDGAELPPVAVHSVLYDSTGRGRIRLAIGVPCAPAAGDDEADLVNVVDRLYHGPPAEPMLPLDEADGWPGERHVWEDK